MGHKDWRAHRHRWVNQRTTSLPRRNPLVKKNYFYIQTEKGGASKAFLRNVFLSPNEKETSLFLVQYLGDLSASKVFSHKNAKLDKATVFVRCKPSKVKYWQTKVENTGAHIVYKNGVTKRTTDEDLIEQEMECGAITKSHEEDQLPATPHMG